MVILQTDLNLLKKNHNLNFKRCGFFIIGFKMLSLQVYIEPFYLLAHHPYKS